ncbi:porin family protein [Catalinimonas alkaloidigena]|nr:porin family protein [Catalinimonas alkaloidigena]
MITKAGVLAFCLLTATTTSYAQVSVAPRIGFGITSVTQAFDPNKPRLTLHAGVEGAYELIENLTLRSGLLLEGKGVRTSDKSGGNSIKASIGFIYLTIPLHAQYSLPIADEFDVWGSAGFYFSAAINGVAKYKYNINGTQSSDSDHIDFGLDNDGIRRGDGGFDIGAGISVPFLANKLDVGFELSLGLVNLNDPDESDELYNRSIKLLARYPLVFE